MKHLLAAASLMVLAHAPAAHAQDKKPLSETCPNLTAEEIDGIENFKGPYSETAIYARTYCVSVEEADRRFQIQLRGSIGPRDEPGPRPQGPPDADPGSLQGLLREKEPDTFAGLWIQHEPTYGIAVAFTRDAAATLARYTSDPIYLPVERPGPSLIELRDTQDRIVNDLIRLGFAWHGAGASEMTGTVEIDLAQEAAPIRAAAERGELDLPNYVILKEPPAFPLAPPPKPAGDTRVTGFPQFPNRTDGGIRTLVGVPDVPARLELRDNCLWLYPEGEEPKIAVWERHMALDLTDPQRVAVTSLFSGAKVYADSRVVLTGLQPGEVTPPENVVGTEGCLGPYRVVRGIQPYEQWAAAARESAISMRQNELGSRAAAIADYEADMARVAVLKAWRDGVMLERCDVVAQIYVDEGQGTAHIFHTAGTRKEALAPAALLPFVTAQEVPHGASALREAKDAIKEQLRAADIAAEVRIDDLQGFVSVRLADLMAIAAVSQRDAIVWPALMRVEPDWQQPFFNPDIPGRREDPEAIWYPLEAHPDFAAIRAIVEDTAFATSEPPPPGQTEWREVMRKPSKAGSLQRAHMLVAYGIGVEDIEELRRAGFDPVTALEDMNGRQTLEKRAMTATDIVIAEPVGIDLRDPGPDGFFSSVRWRVIENIKGDTSPGTELRQRMASGERANEAGEFVYGQGMDEPFLIPGLPQSLEPGSRWVLHLNDALYRHMAHVHGGEGAARTEGDWYISIPWISPARIDEKGVARPVSLYPGPIPVEELRTRIRPIQQAYRVKGQQVR